MTVLLFLNIISNKSNKLKEFQKNLNNKACSCQEINFDLKSIKIRDDSQGLKNKMWRSDF